jgi:dCTP deaminase
MLLTDTMICEYVKHHQMIDPFIDHKVKSVLSYGLDPAGYVITLQPHFLVFNPPKNYMIDSLQQDNIENYELVKQDYVHIPAYGRILGLATERLKLPLNVSAECWGKSSLARIGIVPHITPIEAGYEGNLTIEVSNFNPCIVKLYAGVGIAQVRFHLHETVGTAYQGKYQGASNIELNKYHVEEHI